MTDTAGQWHAPIDCYDRHRRSVTRSNNRLLWPTPEHGQWHVLITDCYGRHRRPVARSNCLLCRHRRPEARSNCLIYGRHPPQTTRHGRTISGWGGWASSPKLGPNAPSFLRLALMSPKRRCRRKDSMIARPSSKQARAWHIYWCLNLTEKCYFDGGLLSNLTDKWGKPRSPNPPTRPLRVQNSRNEKRRPLKIELPSHKWEIHNI